MHALAAMWAKPCRKLWTQYNRSESTLRSSLFCLDNGVHLKHPEEGPTFTYIARVSESEKRRGPPSRIYESRDGITFPKLVVKTTPAYTPEALKAKAQGILMLEAVIGTDGRIRDFKVLKGLGYGLEDQAMQEIATRWKFAPGLKDGKPVDVRIHIETSFQLP